MAILTGERTDIYMTRFGRPGVVSSLLRRLEVYRWPARAGTHPR
jgi:hypothetical protein